MSAHRFPALNERAMLDYLLGADDQGLFALADQIRRDVFGEDIYLRAIIEFSNICNKQCGYCGLRAANAKVPRYRLNNEAILETAALAVSQGAGTIVLQSGDDFYYDTERVGELVRAIKQSHDVAVTLSLGDRGLDEFAHWRACGADRYLIKLETADPALYARMRNGERHGERLGRIRRLRKLGYEVGSGVIVGLPGADAQSCLRDIVRLTEMELEMIAVGPFVPHPDTPLAHAAAGDPTLSHRVSALLRILNPGANIPATSALDAAMPGGRLLGLRRGCNVLMPSMTPPAHRADYFIYPGKNELDTAPIDSLPAAARMVRSLRLNLSTSKGFSRRSSHVR